MTVLSGLVTDELVSIQYLKKRPSVPKCPMTGLKLKGVTPATNQEKARMSRRQKTVFRCLESSFPGFHVFNNYQGIWRSFEPQSSEGKDREGFSHRGAENSFEGAQRSRQELRSEEVIKRGRRIILACSCPTYICCPHRKMTGNAFSEILLSIEDVFQTKRRTPRRVPRVLSRSYCGGLTLLMF